MIFKSVFFQINKAGDKNYYGKYHCKVSDVINNKGSMCNTYILYFYTIDKCLL
ncbi:hypothetical protein YPPY103_0993, partial [Yersinia pestis PY-103]